MKSPIRVAVTGAAGQIGYSLLFRIASGAMFGPDQPVILQLIEAPIEKAMKALEGVAMELDDCAFPLLKGAVLTDDPKVGFKDANWCLLVGAKPRGPGMERADLLKDNGRIFIGQGQIIDAVAADNARVAVVGNPANTNCMIAASQAKRLPAERFTAMTRLDHNRGVAQLAVKLGVHVDQIRGLSVWGNHSALQYPDVNHATVGGTPVRDLVDLAWLVDEFIPRVAGRGYEIIKARGASSAASAASAALDHVYDWVNGTGDQWTSAAIVSDGSYGVPAGLFSSFPVRAIDGRWEIVQGLSINEFARARIDASVAELIEEREHVRALGLLP